MPPGTLHTVMTTEDSLSVGSMLYLPNCYSRSLKTIGVLHRHGQALSNSDYPGAHLILFHLVGHYANILTIEGFMEKTEDDECAGYRTLRQEAPSTDQERKAVFFEMLKSEL
jgi:hypothetical protein